MTVIIQSVDNSRRPHGRPAGTDVGVGALRTFLLLIKPRFAGLPPFSDCDCDCDCNALIQSVRVWWLALWKALVTIFSPLSIIIGRWSDSHPTNEHTCIEKICKNCLQ